MFVFHCTAFGKGTGGAGTRVALGATHTLATLWASTTGAEGVPRRDAWVLGWPYPDPRRRVGAGHRAWGLPLAALGFAPAQVLLGVSAGVEVHHARVVSIDPEAESPASPLVSAAPADPTVEALRDPRNALPEPAVVALRAGLGRWREPELSTEDRRRCWVGVAEAWAALLAARTGQRPILAAVPEAASWPPLAWLGAFDTLVGADDADRAARERFRTAAATWLSHREVWTHAGALLAAEAPEEARRCLEALSCHPDGPCPVLEHAVTVAQGLRAAGAEAEAAARLEKVAERVWGTGDVVRQARALLAAHPERSALKARWAAADALRRAVLAP